MTSETINENKMKTDANVRAILIGKINYKLDLDDATYATDREAARAWLKGIKRQFANYDITEDDQKVVACVRNLSGYVDTLADQHGKFDLFDDFERWFTTTLRIPDELDDIVKELKETVQDGKFRTYGRKFLELQAKNSQCKYPQSDRELRRVFFANMRNVKLKQTLMPRTDCLTDLIVAGEDLILDGLVYDFDESRANSKDAQYQEQSHHDLGDFEDGADDA